MNQNTARLLTRIGLKSPGVGLEPKWLQSLNFAIVDIFVDDFCRRPFLYAVTFFKN